MAKKPTEAKAVMFTNEALACLIDHFNVTQRWVEHDGGRARVQLRIHEDGYVHEDLEVEVYAGD